VRVVDPERPHAVLTPEQKHVAKRLPQRSTVVRLEVDRVDVLVDLRWVLGVLDRAVGAVAEPLGMLAYPWVLRRDLERDVERDLDAPFARRDDEPLQIVERSEIGMHRGVPPLRGADRPRATRIARLGRRRVVLALATCVRDRVDRWQVQHVEPELLDVWEAGDNVVERSVVAGNGRGGTGEQLVPCAEPGERRINVHAELTREGTLMAPVGVAAHEVAEDLVECLVARRRRFALQLFDRRLERVAVGALGTARGSRDQFGADEEVDRDVSACVHLLSKVAPPRREPVDPSDDRVNELAELLDGEAAAEPVVADVLHADLAPVRLD
jgi:hypothetical protein